ncbi:MAG TPA: phage tail tip lysozyme [Candidatus Saccharimonadales bacterium]|nr:phage tail tip lysozyme [Candidatus Saccharimonadales bacterium]
MKHTFRTKLVIALSFFSTLIMLFASTPLVQALTPQERWHYANIGIEFIDDPCAPAGEGAPDAGGGGGGGGEDAAKYPHIKDAFVFFMQQGYSAAQSAGIVGNLIQESGWSISPTASDGVAHGIAQWQGGRLQPMWSWVAAWASKNGDKDGKNSFQGQLHYLVYDLNGQHSSVKKKILALNNEVEVANAWNKYYEISADTSSKRGDNARKVLAAANAGGWANGIVVKPDDPNASTTPDGEDGGSDCATEEEGAGSATGKTCKDIGKKSDDDDPKDPYRCNSSELKCAAGTDMGVGAAYAGGRPYKIRLCKVQGVVVNAFIAANIDNMMTAAKKDGIALSGAGGGFRTMDAQISIRRSNGCPADHLGSKDANGFYDYGTLLANKNRTAPTTRCGTPAAPPGFSNHQTGLAVDWSYKGSTIGSHGSAAFKWMDAHAKTYGFYNFPVEPWHWSVDGA